ncbi:MAG TPA: hypothetical protein VFU71_18090 [Burkholderiaceae bacterium]|nr:hypothetical protein [Burkholderiaceae bacterium]
MKPSFRLSSFVAPPPRSLDPFTDEQLAAIQQAIRDGQELIKRQLELERSRAFMALAMCEFRDEYFRLNGMWLLSDVNQLAYPQE